MKNSQFITALLPVALVGCQAHIEMTDHISTLNTPQKDKQTAIPYINPETKGGILYVDKNATGREDGKSWATAFRSLQQGMDAAAHSRAELWVAQGTYIPKTEKRDKCFTIAKGTIVYGSLLAGTEDKDSRDNLHTPTILSGNIGEAKTANDNCYHVVTAETGVLLSGLVIAGGFADGITPHNAGGGLLPALKTAEGKEPYTLTLDRIIFRDNYAQLGGALFVNSAEKIEASTSYFRTNSALYGGAAIIAGDEVELNDVHFFANSATYEAGALCLDDGVQAALNSCLFTNNTAGKSAGALQIRGGGAANQATATIDDTLFTGNKASEAGGAVENINGATIHITRSHLHDNRAEKGEDIATFGEGKSTTEHCVFIEGRKIFSEIMP